MVPGGFIRHPFSNPRDLAAYLRLIAPVGFSIQSGTTLQFDFGIGGVGCLE
jgi:hypothetical protein